MKSKLTTAILMFAATLGFANELPVSQSLPAITEKANDSKSFTYLRMGVTDSYPVDSVKVIPGIGLGYRLNSGNAAIDISANYTGVVGSKEDIGTYFYTLPKASYLYYITPAKSESFYAGAGLAFGGMKTKDEREFQGFIPSVTAGYEMNRKGNWRSFVQMDVSQPALATRYSNPPEASSKRYPGPVAEMAVGLGF